MKNILKTIGLILLWPIIILLALLAFGLTDIILAYIVSGVMVVAAIYYLYNYFKNKNNTLITANSIKQKYSFLIDSILNGRSDVKIYEEKTNFISLGSSSYGGSTQFKLTQISGRLMIHYVSNSAHPLIGNITKEWSFPEEENQERILKRMMTDIEYEINKRLTDKQY